MEIQAFRTDLSDRSVKQRYFINSCNNVSVGVPMEMAKAAINNGFKASDWTLDSGSLRFVSTVLIRVVDCTLRVVIVKLQFLQIFFVT